MRKSFKIVLAITAALLLLLLLLEYGGLNSKYKTPQDIQVAPEPVKK